MISSTKMTMTISFILILNAKKTSCIGLIQKPSYQWGNFKALHTRWSKSVGYLKGVASHCKDETTFTFQFSILTNAFFIIEK